MEQEEVPHELIARFRARAGERLEKAEAAWTALIAGTGDPERDSVELRRELHTLKGDASTVGFSDVQLLCHKLEDLVGAAQRRGYRVPDEIDIVATMGFRFVGLLCRKPVGRSLGGIDLAGFVAQIDEAVHDAAVTEVARPAPVAPREAIEIAERLSPDARRRLLSAATDVWLEAQNSDGAARTRLLHSSAAICAVLASVDGCDLEPTIARHARAVAAMGRESGKDIQGELEMADVAVTRAVAEAADTAVLHLVRNAVDHGIERPEARAAAGKPRLGRVSIRIALVEGSLTIDVSDDGAGIDFAAVRRRAIETGALSENASHDQLIDVLFTPGFTTRPAATRSSGRGIGLDAVRDAVRRLDGLITVHSEPGRGTTFRLNLPRAASTVDVHRFVSAGGDPLCVPGDWHASAARGARPPALDPLARLGVRAPETRPSWTVALRRDGIDCAVLAGSAPVTAVARRLAASDEPLPAELVLLDGSPALMLRPEALAAVGDPAP